MAGINIDFIVKNNEAIKNLDEFSKKYNQLSRDIVQGASNFGRSTRQQEQYILDEITSLNRKRDVMIKIIELSKENQRLLEREADLQRRFERGGMPLSRFNENRDDLRYRRESNIGKLLDLGVSNSLSSDEIRQTERQADLLEEVSDKLTDLVDTSKDQARGILAGSPEEARRIIAELRRSEDPNDILAANLAEARLNDTRGTSSGRRDDVFESVLGVRNFQTFVNSFLQLARTRNGYDALEPVGQMGGQAIGAIIDKLSGKGTNLWSAILGTIGQASMATLNMHAIPLSEYAGRLNRFRGITGQGNPILQSQANIGFSLQQYGDLINDFAISGAGTADPIEQARRSLRLQRAYGISQGTSTGLSQLMRSGSSTDRDLYNLIVGALEAGAENIFRHDRSFLNEFMSQNFTTMQREFVKMQGEVSSGTTMGMFNAFEKIGGQFGARHQNSMSNISSIHQALVNPQSDNMQALSFLALRQANPGMGIADLLLEREKGASSASYRNNMLDLIKQIGGGDQMMRMNIAGAFGLSASAAKELFDNMDAFMSGSRNIGELKTTRANEIETNAEILTTTMEKNAAMITDGMIMGFKEGIKGVVEAITDAFLTGVSGLDVTVVNSDGKVVHIKNDILKNASRGSNGKYMHGQFGYYAGSQNFND